MLSKNGVLKNFVLVTEKHLCWRLFLIKLQTFRLLQLMYNFKFDCLGKYTAVVDLDCIICIMIHCFKEQKRKYLAFQSSLPKKYRNLPRESLRYHGNFRETIKTHINIGNEIEKLLANLRIAFGFFYKQLMSGFSPESCWYFQGFRSSKLLNGCLVDWPSNLCLRGMQ